jgi:hypothetical protein
VRASSGVRVCLGVAQLFVGIDLSECVRNAQWNV